MKPGVDRAAVFAETFDDVGALLWYHNSGTRHDEDHDDRDDDKHVGREHEESLID